jgi:hypothetical protein
MTDLECDFEYDFEAAYYEVEILKIWDALPDYVKTSGLWRKIESMGAGAIISQLRTLQGEHIKTV